MIVLEDMLKLRKENRIHIRPKCPRCSESKDVVISWDFIHVDEGNMFHYIKAVYCNKKSCEKLILTSI